MRPRPKALLFVLILACSALAPIPAHALLLDDLSSTPTFAFSLSRYLRSAEVGNTVVDLHETVGSTTQAFKLNGSNVLVTNDVNEDTVSEWLTAAGASEAWVARIYDQSGNGRHATAPLMSDSNVYRPLLVEGSGIGGVAAMRFQDSTSLSIRRRLLTPSITITATQGHYAFTLVRPQFIDAASSAGLLLNSAATSLAWIGYHPSATPVWNFRLDGSPGVDAESATQVEDGVPVLMTWHHSGSATDNVDIRKNGVEIHSETLDGLDWRSGTHGIGNMGVTSITTSAGWDGEIAEVIYYNGQFSTTDRDTIEASMITQGGLAAEEAPGRIIRLKGNVRLLGGIRLR